MRFGIDDSLFEALYCTRDACAIYLAYLRQGFI